MRAALAAGLLRARQRRTRRPHCSRGGEPWVERWPSLAEAPLGIG